MNFLLVVGGFVTLLLPWIPLILFCNSVFYLRKGRWPMRGATRLAQLEAFVRQVANHEMSDNQNIRRAKELCAAATANSVVSQHLAWLNLYVREMSADNWLDMKDRLKSQLEKLSTVLHP